MTDEDFLVNIENMFQSLSFEDNSDENFAVVRMKLEGLSSAMVKIEKTINMLIDSFSKLLNAMESSTLQQETELPEAVPIPPPSLLSYKDFVKVLSEKNYAAINKELALSVLSKYVEAEFQSQPLNHIKPEFYKDCLNELEKVFTV